jgi:hypothetical protein
MLPISVSKLYTKVLKIIILNKIFIKKDMEQEIKNLMVEFVLRNYKISRIKKDGKFQRAIQIDEKTYFFKHKLSTVPIKNILAKKLMLIFDCDTLTSFDVINKTLNI